ncbi:MAG: Flp pilus assembly protein CpaB [Actinomycetota bacterium]|jgi:Flp pilus assembly protein CpaB
MAKRSNLIVVLGLAVFLVGAGATYLLARDDGGSAASGPRVAVLYAAKPIPSGTSGGNALNQGLVKSKQIPESAKPANALTDPSQLAGLNAVLGVPEGQVLTADQWAQAQTRIGTLTIPDGKTALALELANVPGVAGFAGAGDRINIYGLLSADASQSQAKLIMQGVEILNVNGSTLAGAAGRPDGAGLVFLLAVSPEEGEQLVYLTSFQRLYFALAAKDQPPVGGTPGVNAGQALKTL